MGKRKELAGQRFGKLVVVKSTGKNTAGRYLWECICDCGKHIVLRSDLLRRGISDNCGCLTKEKMSRWGLKHGKTINGNPNGNTTYVSWKGMKQRCCNPNSDQYHYYGARGVTVCDRWINSFENFLEDMGERPEGLTLDRIDSNGNYEPGNCRWADYYIQNNNKRRHYYI